MKCRITIEHTAECSALEHVRMLEQAPAMLAFVRQFEQHARLNSDDIGKRAVRYMADEARAILRAIAPREAAQ